VDLEDKRTYSLNDISHYNYKLFLISGVLHQILKTCLIVSVILIKEIFNLNFKLYFTN